MRLLLSAGTAMMTMFSIMPVNAADLTLLGATGGFLLGNAHRCQIAGGRIVRAAGVIQDMIHAASHNSAEENLALAQFGAAFLSSAYPEVGGDPVMPLCGAVVSQFERLERHHREADFTD